MNPIMRKLFLVALVVLSLVGCGGSNAEVGEATMTPQEPAPDAEGPVELHPEDIEGGQVTLTLAESPYVKGSVIMVTVANGLDQTVYTADMKSDCSPIVLERQNDSGGWESFLNCAMERIPLIIAIEPGKGYLVTLDPNSTHFTGGVSGAEPGIDVGTYRLVFTYRLEPGAEGIENEVVTTEPFLVIP